jgi:hypothetical protein
MRNKKRKDRDGWGWVAADVLVELGLLPFRILWWILRGFGKILEAIFDGLN